MIPNEVESFKFAQKVLLLLLVAAQIVILLGKIVKIKLNKERPNSVVYLVVRDNHLY